MRNIVQLMGLVILLSACQTLSSDNQAPVMSFSDYLAACGSEAPAEQCIDKHGSKIAMKGGLYYLDNWVVAYVFPEGIEVPAHSDDEAWDKVPDDFLILKVDNTDKRQTDRLLSLHTQTIMLEGHLDSTCLMAHLHAREEAERTGNIIWASGFCHSQSDVVSPFEIKDIKK